MKKRVAQVFRVLWWAGVIAAVLALPVLHLLWRLSPEHRLDVLVYDVTVADDRYREHAVLDRIFTHERVEFAVGTDHVGSAPGGTPFGRWPDGEPDLIVLADGYGVYADDDGRVDDFGQDLVSPILTEDEAADVARWVAAGVPAYAEFAFTPRPTSREASELIQDAFGFDSTGWLGHVETDLAEVGPSIRALGPDPWPYRGPGMVFVTTPAGEAAPRAQLVVLTADQLTALQPDFVGGPVGSKGERAPFVRWFELIEPERGTRVDSWLEIPVNEAGAEILTEAGLPTRWPGVVTTATTAYVVGDGLEDDSRFLFRHFAAGDYLSWRLHDMPEERFFHLVLRPALARTVSLAVARYEAELNSTE